MVSTATTVIIHSSSSKIFDDSATNTKLIPSSTTRPSSMTVLRLLVSTTTVVVIIAVTFIFVALPTRPPMFHGLRQDDRKGKDMPMGHIVASSSSLRRVEEEDDTLSTSQPPSSLPSDFPSEAPSIVSGGSDLNPSSLPPIPSGMSIRLKMYWERSYYWQEEERERHWCLECTTCKELTTSDRGEGCYDPLNNGGYDCYIGDQLWIQECQSWNDGWYAHNARFEIIRNHNRGTDQIKIWYRDLCLTRVEGSHRLLTLMKCNANEVRQMFTGFSLTAPFAIRPFVQDGGVEQRCLSQHHHPKQKEIIFLESCDLAYTANTALWEAIY